MKRISYALTIYKVCGNIPLTSIRQPDHKVFFREAYEGCRDMAYKATSDGISADSGY
jgi:hypothetical protein